MWVSKKRLFCILALQCIGLFSILGCHHFSSLFLGGFLILLLYLVSLFNILLSYGDNFGAYYIWGMEI